MAWGMQRSTALVALSACLLLACFLQACAPSGPSAPDTAVGPSADCAMAVNRMVGFVERAPTSRIEARALPATSCEMAVLVLTVRAPDGRPLHAFAAPYAQLAKDPTAARLKQTLEQWTAAVVDDTSAAPAWDGAADAFPKDFGPSGATPYMRPIYERLRAEKRPRLCFATSYEALRCLYYEAESGQADILFTTGQ